MKFLTNIDLNRNELQNAKAQNLAIAPASPSQGLFYFNTGDGTFYGYNGTKWIDFSYKHPATHSISEISGLQTILDEKSPIHSHPYRPNTWVPAWSDVTNKPTFSTVATSGSYADLSNKPSFGTAATKNVGVASGEIPILDSNGKLADSVIPAVAITDTFVVDNESKMLALSVQVGDIAVRTDINKSFILQRPPASTLENWIELKTPDSKVTSVAGKTGAVTLGKGDIGLGNVDNTSDNVKSVASAVKWTSPRTISFTGALTGSVSIDGSKDVSLNTNLISHNHSSDNINEMTGYTKPSSTGSILATDTLNQAVGKLEKALDGKQASGNYEPANPNIQSHISSAHLALGTTSSTAFRGDQGKIAYDHSQSTHAPTTAQKNSDITKAEIEAKLIGNITTHTHNYAQKYSVSIGDGSNSAITVTHNLGTEDITVSVKETATKQFVFTEIEIVDANNIKLLFASAPALNAYRVTVTG